MKKNISACFAVYTKESDKFEFSDKESNDCFKVKTLTRADRRALGLAIKNDDHDKLEEIFASAVDDSKSVIKKDQFDTDDILFLLVGLIKFCELSTEEIQNFQ